MSTYIDPDYIQKMLKHAFENFGFEVTYCDRMHMNDSIAIMTGFEVPMFKMRMGQDGMEEELKKFYDKFKNSRYSKDLEATYKMEADMLREELEELKEQNNKLLDALSDGMEVLEIENE
jgi:hypothetical protein